MVRPFVPTVVASSALSIVMLAPRSIATPFAPSPQYSPDAVLVRTPDVSATQLVFQFGGDLWLSDRDGGVATRLTSAEGTESLPKFSPDGSKVAFMADYDGGTDIYVVDVAGGPPTRVTYHPGRETLCNWHPDGESLLYFSSEESGIARAPKIFRIPAAGGTAEPLPVPYGTFCEIDPTGTWIAYTPLTREGRTWRRYRGGMAQDIWLFNLKTLESRRVTEDPGTDRIPMWFGDRLIFLSDRGAAGIANLYEYDTASGTKRPLTSFASSGARYPSIGPGAIVFEQGGGLFLYELDSGAIRRVRVTIPGDRPTLRPVQMDLADRATNVTVSRTGKRVALEARGEIFSVPVEEGVTRNLTRTSGVAERAPSLSPDGGWVAYWSDRSGEYELTLRRADGSDFEGSDDNGERRLTATGRGWKGQPSWSPDGETIAWSNHNGEIYAVDVESGLDAEPTFVGEAASPQYVGLSWSPDSNWLAWSARSSESRLDAIYLYDLEAGERHEVTSGMFDDSEPAFSREGDWLYFHSSRRFSPTYADLDSTWIYEDSRRLMAVPLRDDVELPWDPKNVEEEVEEDADDEEGEQEEEPGEEPGEEPEEESDESDAEDGEETESADDASEDSEDEEETIEIDLEGFEERVVALPVEPGIAGGLIGLDGAVLFARVGDGGASLFRFDLESHEDGPKEVLGSIEGYELTHDGQKLLVRSRGKHAVVSPAPGQKIDDAIELTAVRGRFDPREEWPQMIHDVHRLFRDWFYDAQMHGVDWDGLRDRALAALPDATSRADVHFLIGEMLSELNVGHAYNRTPPGGFGRAAGGAPTGLVGAEWKPVDDGFRIMRVIGSPRETDGRGPLHGKAKVDDVLIAIDGIPVDPSRSVHEHFVGTAGRATVLTLRSGDEEREVVVEPMRSERSLRYRDWVASKRAWVHEASEGRIGYIHVPSTGIDGQNELYRQFMAERHRDALVIDERWNSGGQIPTRFVELLSRRPTNAWAMRDGKHFEWPPVYHDGPKVMLINHSAGSGGDAFPWYFRELGLGKLIGTRTWGGLVGISGNPALVDGASPSVPTFGFYELDGTWGVEGHGVDPDIEVVDDPALMVEGRDPQLERAITELRAEIDAWTYQRPERPASPDRSGAGLPMADR
ncbi:MAG: S41 family peptidase [Planctomycetota bacterium]